MCLNDERVLLSLPTRFSGLGVPLFHENAVIEFENSRKLTSPLTDLIKNKSVLYTVNGTEQKKIKTTIKNERENIHKNVFNILQNRLNENQLRLNSIHREKGVSIWLTSYSISDHGFDPQKQQFWDSLIPSTCFCSANIDVQHAMSCKRGGFVTIRHNDLRDLTANLLSNVSNDVEIEPKLLLVTGENFSNRTMYTRTEARLDIRSRGFWVRGQQAFFDIKYLTQTLKDTLTQLFYNARNIMRKRKRGSTARGFYKLNTETSPRWYFQYTEV